MKDQVIEEKVRENVEHLIGIGKACELNVAIMQCFPELADYTERESPLGMYRMLKKVREIMESTGVSQYVDNDLDTKRKLSIDEENEWKVDAVSTIVF